MAATWQQPAESLPWSGSEQTSQYPALHERNNMERLRTGAAVRSKSPLSSHQRKAVSVSFPLGPSTGGGDDHICRNCLPGNNPEPSTVVPKLLRIFSHSPATSSANCPLWPCAGLLQQLGQVRAGLLPSSIHSTLRLTAHIMASEHRA